MRTYESWGRYPRAAPAEVVPVVWRTETPRFEACRGPLLAYGQGRSYGDSCLNAGGTLLDTAPLGRMIALDVPGRRLRCEAGATLADVLAVAVPRGLFLPVVPGTKLPSVGGSIANDVHGKNHHVAGTFGSHVARFELLRSSGERLLCSASENADLYRATIGGLGLTGLILWAELELRPIASSFLAVEIVRFPGLDSFFELSRESDKAFEYTVAWIDALARGRSLGRGVFLRANHLEAAPAGKSGRSGGLGISVPFQPPVSLLPRLATGLFNELYFRTHPTSGKPAVRHYDPFFFPLDAVEGWNRLYGPHGFVQYQCVLPHEAARAALREVLGRIAGSGDGSFLSVLKTFGDVPSPGLLSFPRPGVSLALDFPFRGERTLRLLDALDAVVEAAGGALYPAKDARMSREMFERSFPALPEFRRHVDPAFSSSFWRRVAEAA